MPDLTVMLRSQYQLLGESKRRGDVQDLYSALVTINSVMPDDPDPNNELLWKYRVAISDTLYQQVTQRRMIYQCPECGPQDWDQSQMGIRAFDIIEHSMRGISGPASIKTWDCPACGTTWDMDQVPRYGYQEMIGPVMYGVVPLPPTRKEGILADEKYKREWRVWATRMEGELAERVSAYRRDYKAQGLEEEDFDVEVLQ